MSKTKFKAHDKSVKELEAMVVELNGKITQARIDLGTKKTNDVKLIYRLKKDLARSLTVLTERQIEAAAKTSAKETKDE